MGRPVALIAPVLLSLQLAGCATWALMSAPDHADAPWTPATNSAGEIVAGERAPPGQPPKRDYVLPSNSNLAGVPAPASELERHRPYTLPEMIDIAESSNPTTRNAWNDARDAALVAGIAESTFLPLVSAGIVQGWQQSHSENSTLGLTSTSNTTAQGNIEALSIQWLLFDFGERAALVDAAKQGSVISNIAFTAAHQQVIYNVSLAFYAYAAARERLASAGESLRDAEEVGSAAQNRYKQGIGTVVEVTQTRQATAQAQLERIQAEGAAENAYLALISALGVSPITKLRIADVSRRKLSTSMMAPVERVVSAALARRPDVLTGYAALRASLANLQAAQAAFLPKVFLAANGTRLSGSLDITAIPGIGKELPILNLPNQVGFSGTQFGSTALIGATVPVYDGGVRAASLEQARDKVDKAETTLSQIRNEAARQIIVARNNLKTSLSAYSASTTLAAAAQTTFNAALASYRNGVGSITDVTLSERQLLAAKNAQTDAYSTALSSAATLALAAGALGAAPHQ
ncbi:MAG TPA: TolC family protein [Xanthobacteraceae bacterium]|nr:TolC family protein [Xanthobacteraceae bacterium]